MVVAPAEGPLQPFADTLTPVLPAYSRFHVITAVLPKIATLPAFEGLSDQLYPVAFAAVALKVLVPLLSLIVVGPEGAETVPTNPSTVIASVTGIVDALQPAVTTPIVAEPLKDGLQVTTPDVPEPLILPAADGVIDQT